MVLLLFLLLFVAPAVGLVLAPGLGLFAVVPAALALLYGIWLVAAFRGGRSPGSVVREAPPDELLGPDGEDAPAGPFADEEPAPAPRRGEARAPAARPARPRTGLIRPARRRQRPRPRSGARP